MQETPKGFRRSRVILALFLLGLSVLLLMQAVRDARFKTQLTAHGFIPVQVHEPNPFGYASALSNLFTGHVSPAHIVQVNAPSTSDDGLALCLQMPNLELATFNGRGVTDDGIAHLASCLRLQELSLANTSVNGVGLHHLARSTSLVRLDLTGTQVDDADIDKVTRLSSVQSLFLSGPGISDASLEELFAMPNLSLLYLAETNVTATACRQHIDARPGVECMLINDGQFVQLSTADRLLRVGSPGQPDSPR